MENILLASTLAKIVYNTSSISLNENETFCLRGIKAFKFIPYDEMETYLEELNEVKSLGFNYIEWINLFIKTI